MSKTLRREVPSKSERDDGGSNEIGVIGFIFGAIVYGAFIWAIVEAIF